MANEASADVPLSDQRTVEFELDRKRLLRLSYRMLGSITEAEDVVQDAWLRWVRVEDEVRNPDRLSHSHRHPTMP